MRIAVLSETRAMRGDLVLGGDNGFIAKALSCNACGFVGFFCVAAAAPTPGGAGIFLGGGAKIESR